VYNHVMAKDVIRVSESGSGERLRLADGPRALWHRGGHRRQLATCCRRSEPHARLLSESLRLAREHGSTVTLDGDFGRDLEEIINSHREPLSPPAWD